MLFHSPSSEPAQHLAIHSTELIATLGHHLRKLNVDDEKLIEEAGLYKSEQK